MKSKLTILVLGVGGNVSQGILKALSKTNIEFRVIAACTSASAFGLYTVDKALISPSAHEEKFLDWLLKICIEESVDAILSGVEPVLFELARFKEIILDKTGAICLVNDLKAMEIGGDKLLTCEWLRNNNFSYPYFAANEDLESVNLLIEKCGFPLIAKPRNGKGSQGIYILKNKEDLGLLKNLQGYVIQEMLGDDESEYTAACLTDSNDLINGIIVFKRYLLAGTTSCAIAVDYPEIKDMVAKIAEKLKPKGPCNVQMRVHQGKPVCFELNVRFSGTTPIRASLGFNDVVAAIRHYVMGEKPVDLPEIHHGQVIRYWNEAYISPDAFNILKSFGQLENPKEYPFSIETYANKS